MFTIDINIRPDMTFIGAKSHAEAMNEVNVGDWICTRAGNPGDTGWSEDKYDCNCLVLEKVESEFTTPNFKVYNPKLKIVCLATGVWPVSEHENIWCMYSTSAASPFDERYAAWLNLSPAAMMLIEKHMKAKSVDAATIFKISN